MTKFYSEKRLNTLLLKSEDLLRDNQLGTHLVGIYPILSRDRSEQEGIFCLYIDSVESLLNPFIKSNKDLFKKDSIHMMDIFYWVSNLPLMRLDLNNTLMSPIENEIIHEEESISPIIEAASRFINYKINEEEIGNLIADLYRSLA